MTMTIDAVAEACRVLKTGGRAAFTVWGRPDRARFMGVLLDAVATVGASAPSDLPAGPPIFRFSDDDEFKRLLTSAGLEQPEVLCFQYGHRFASLEEVWSSREGSASRCRLHRSCGSFVLLSMTWSL